LEGDAGYRVLVQAALDCDRRMAGGVVEGMTIAALAEAILF
jgi:hypothetical protein